PVYLTIAVMPVLLTAMAVTDEIHVYSRYFALLHENPATDHRKLVQETMDEMVCPVVNTSLTTAIGFVSFAFSPLGPVVAFGLFTGLGVLFCLFWSLSVMPALLSLIDPARLRARLIRPGRTKILSTKPWFSRFAFAAVRHRSWIIGVVALILILTPFGLRRLVIQDSWIDGFDPSSEFSRATRLVNQQFHGMHLLNVSLDAADILRGEMPTSDIGFAKFSFPTNLIANPGN